MHLIQSGAEFGLVIGVFGAFRNWYAVAFRQCVARFVKAKMLNLHQKVKNVPAGVAAMAVVELQGRVDGKRRSLFVMERAQTGVSRSHLSQSHVILNHAYDVHRRLELLYEVHEPVCQPIIE